MASRNRPKRAAVRGKSAKTHYASGLTEIVSETVRLWRKHHLDYDQTKYVVEQARRRLKLQPLGTRRRTVDRLDKSEVERLIRNAYQSHSKYGLMIKTLFLSGARVDEFVHIRSRGSASWMTTRHRSRVLGSNGTENSLKNSGDLDHRIGTGS